MKYDSYKMTIRASWKFKWLFPSLVWLLAAIIFIPDINANADGSLMTCVILYMCFNLVGVFICVIMHGYKLTLDEDSLLFRDEFFRKTLLDINQIQSVKYSAYFFDNKGNYHMDKSLLIYLKDKTDEEVSLNVRPFDPADVENFYTHLLNFLKLNQNKTS